MKVKTEETQKDTRYAFPWGFHLGSLRGGNEEIPLYTGSDDGGFTLLYDKASEAKVDRLIESLCLELLTKLPHGSLKVEMFDYGKKKFYSLSTLQNIELYETAYSDKMMYALFDRLEKRIIQRHKEVLCCNRPSITEHNQKSKRKERYHLVLIHLKHFPTREILSRRIRNFVESAFYAGVYVIAFGDYEDIESDNENVQIFLKHFKTLKATEGVFEIDQSIFEFPELLKKYNFEPLNLDKANLLQTIFANADLESMMDPEKIKLESNTKV